MRGRISDEDDRLLPRDRLVFAYLDLNWRIQGLALIQPGTRKLGLHRLSVFHSKIVASTLIRSVDSKLTHYRIPEVMDFHSHFHFLTNIFEFAAYIYQRGDLRAMVPGPHFDILRLRGT